MKQNTNLKNVHKLIDIMARLRSADGCAWDRQQTPESLKKHILEETYELLEAIDNGNPEEICDELGDLLLQVIFQAQIFSEAGKFTINEVADAICQKLIRRHPHIFADASHKNHEQRWEEIKRRERQARGQSDSIARRIPANLPALKRATKFVRKCRPLEPEGAIEQMQSHINQIKQQLDGKPPSETSLEGPLSQLLIEICSLAAATGLETEDLLRQKTTQLISEFDSKNNL